MSASNSNTLPANLNSNNQSLAAEGVVERGRYVFNCVNEPLH